MYPNNVRKYRRDRGWSLDELVGRAHVARSQLQLVEAHKRSPSVAWARRLATAFGVTLDALFPASKSDE